jgi:2-oxoisovalerate dehydrogenase E2 component (dihydrolipoyl transacylase)
MPQLGETVTEGTVARWLKKPGENVEKYEAFVEVSTDKVNADVPSPVAGTIRELIVAEGETVPTGAPIAIIDEVAGLRQAQPDTVAAQPGTVAAQPALVTPSLSRGSQQTAASPAPVTNGYTNGAGANGLRVSPAVRRLAREHAVDIASISGTGANGRVTAADIVAAATTPRATTVIPTTVIPSEAPVPRVVEGPPPSVAPQSAPPSDDDTIVPLSPARRLIARRMVESKHTAPHAWTMVEVDVSDLWAWRTAVKDAFEREHGVKLTLLPFFMFAVTEALRKFPMMNASFYENGIAVHKHVNLGIATATEGNLVVPVVRNAEERSIRGIAVAAGALIDKARRGKLDVDDLSGGTFTVNNNGASGSILSAPILVPGQAGMVTMESVVKRPVVRNDAIAIRSMMNVCLSLDHRVVDGAVAIGFLADLKKRLEAMGPSGAL